MVVTVTTSPLIAVIVSVIVVLFDVCITIAFPTPKPVTLSRVAVFVVPSKVVIL
ncbi:hypothetical protein D3C72_2271730 [compost metagenome]